MITKTKRGWEVISHKSGKSLGIYPTTKAGHNQAELRLKQIEAFKHMIKSKGRK